MPIGEPAPAVISSTPSSASIRAQAGTTLSLNSSTKSFATITLRVIPRVLTLADVHLDDAVERDAGRQRPALGQELPDGVLADGAGQHVPALARYHEVEEPLEVADVRLVLHRLEGDDPVGAEAVGLVLRHALQQHGLDLPHLGGEVLGRLDVQVALVPKMDVHLQDGPDGDFLFRSHPGPFLVRSRWRMAANRSFVPDLLPRVIGRMPPWGWCVRICLVPCRATVQPSSRSASTGRRRSLATSPFPNSFACSWSGSR